MGFKKPLLRKQRTRFFSRLLRNAPLKKKANVRAATTCSSEQRKGGKKAFFHNKLAVSSSASAGFFLKAPHSTVERTILCPLFSPHPQNQSVQNKILSSLPLRACITISSLLRAAITTRHTISSGTKQTPGRVYGMQAAQALQMLILTGKKVEKYFKKGLALI